MSLGFNTSANNQTRGRTTTAVNMGKLRSTIGSTTRKFNYCNRGSPDLNVTFNCVFNRPIPTPIPTPLDIEGGNIQTIVTENGYVYLSQDYGQTWKKNSQLADLGYALYGNAMSLDGKYQTTCDTVTNGKICLSNNSGNSWSNQTTGLPSDFFCETGEICMSGSGQYQYSINEYEPLTSASLIYRSTDFGNTWKVSSLQPYDTDHKLFSSNISCDTSGKYGVTIAITNSLPSNGSLFITSDFGDSWNSGPVYTAT